MLEAVCGEWDVCQFTSVPWSYSLDLSYHLVYGVRTAALAVLSGSAGGIGKFWSKIPSAS